MGAPRSSQHRALLCSMCPRRLTKEPRQRSTIAGGRSPQGTPMAARNPAPLLNRGAPARARGGQPRTGPPPARAAKASLAAFLSRFAPAVAALARAALARTRALTPPSYELVYDAYNALSVGFSFNERTSEHFLHVAVYPRHVNVGFPFGISLTDPERRLLGCGSRVRHLTIRTRSDLRDPALARFVREAAEQALARATTPPPARRRLVIKAIYARQRPRRPPSS
jgi:hypothetical protein